MIKFKNADKAFNYYKKQIPQWGVDFDDTKALFNVGFEIQNPIDNLITDEKRDWKKEYAEAEWQWYLSGDNNIKKLGEIYGKVPEIWKRMANQWGYVNSNYGWQWQRIDNGIKIGPIPLWGEDYGNWTVEITMNGKTSTDPNKYKKESIMHKVYEYCDYYYNKYKKDD